MPSPVLSVVGGTRSYEATTHANACPAAVSTAPGQIRLKRPIQGSRWAAVMQCASSQCEFRVLITRNGAGRVEHTAGDEGQQTEGSGPPLSASAAYDGDFGCIGDARQLATAFLTEVQAVHGLPVSERA